MSITVETGFDNEETVQLPDYPDTGMESGVSSAGDMEAWNDPESIVSELLAGTYINKSSYPIPAYISEATAFDNSETVQHTGRELGTEVGYTYLGTRASGTVLVSPNPEADNPDTYRLEGITLHTTDGVNQFTATADPTTGEYELPLGESGDYEIEARHPALEPVTTTISPADGESVPNTDILMPLESAGGGSSAAGLVRRRIG